MVLAAGVPSSVYEYHHSTDGFELSWTAVDREDPDVLGSARILPLRQVVQDWKGVVYFDDGTAYPDLPHFKVVDFFTDETCAGVFTTAVDDESVYVYVYVYDFEDEPVRLDLDVFGHTELLCAARGFFYRPHSVLAAKGTRDTHEADRFRTAMPALFPDFSWPGFVEQYEDCACRTGDGHGRGPQDGRVRSGGGRACPAADRCAVRPNAGPDPPGRRRTGRTRRRCRPPGGGGRRRRSRAARSARRRPRPGCRARRSAPTACRPAGPPA